jgi:hypothetical protein
MISKSHCIAAAFLITLSTVVKSQNVFPTSGFTGIGTQTPGALLHVADIYPAGGINLLLGDDSFLSDIDVANTLGIYGAQNNDRAGIKLGSTGPVLFGLNNSLGIGVLSPAPQTTLHVYESGSSSSIWRGRIVSSGSSSAVVMGEWNGKASIGAHSPTLDAWNDLYLQFAGGRVAIGTQNLGPQTKLHVFETGTSTNLWRGRIVSSGDNNAVVMGEVNGKASFGAHNASLTSWSDLFINWGGGNVGIGTQTASQRLEVSGGVLQNAENVGWGIDFQTNARLGFIKKAGYGPMMASDNSSPIIFAQTNQNGIHTNIPGATLTERMRIDVNGNVGIGTSSPGSFRLAVNGKIWTQEVNVQMTNPGPDYVFEKNYDLLSLTELETYINQNKHLPQVPSAKEMEKDGLNLKEMNMILLKKVEELTLHLIEMKKENERQNQLIKQILNK